MRNDIKKAVEAVTATDSSFTIDSVYETDDEIVLISDEPGVPPYIVSKADYAVRMVEIGEKRDMELAYKKSVRVVGWDK